MGNSRSLSDHLDSTRRRVAHESLWLVFTLPRAPLKALGSKRSKNHSVRESYRSHTGWTIPHSYVNFVKLSTEQRKITIFRFFEHMTKIRR
ncbi:hypothetical protein V6Z11_D07G115400 [Gossypium hirsutum]